MAERPILFSAPMVRAILAGTKTQTRRALRDGTWWNAEHGVIRMAPAGLACTGFKRVACPYGQPGDRLWVRETFMHEPADYCWEASVSIPCRPATTVYRADHDGDTHGAGWKPSIHMPRALSRITLEITGVRVERLQDISEADATAEGVAEWARGACAADNPYDLGPVGYFELLWSSINGRASWDANPWVWVVEFKPVKP